MMSVQFLVEWAVRSSILIGLGAMLPRLVRVKGPSIRLAACIAAVCGSLAVPLFSTAFPKWPVLVMPAVESRLVPVSTPIATSADGPVLHTQIPAATHHFDWGTAAIAIYGLVAGFLLLRLATGMTGIRKLRRGSRATSLVAGGIEVRESALLTSPLAIGMVRPAIVLPADWREWDRTMLDAVLAHESSHVRRRDPAVQFVSAIHRALLWHSPLSWMLHRRIVRLAEEASDDAAVAVTCDRASYAEMVLGFMQRGIRVNWQRVAMARYERPGERIDRILDGSVLSAGVTRKAAIAIFAVAVPLAYVTGAAIPAHAVRAGSGASAANSVRAVQHDFTSLPAGTRFVAAVQDTAATAVQTGGTASGMIRRYVIVLGDTQSGSWDSAIARIRKGCAPGSVPVSRGSARAARPM